MRLLQVLCLAAFAHAGVLSAQTSSSIVRGRVTGPDGAPLGKQAVVLHRVTGPSGITVATGESADDGTFRLQVSDVDPAGDAVYFLAARYKVNGELYIGDAFKAPFDTTVMHTVQVGVAETSARALVAGTNAEAALPTAPPPPDPTRWLVIVMPALAIAALFVMLFTRRGRIPARRRLLLEIAHLDESHSRATATGDAGSSDYSARRAALIAQLNAPAEV